MATVVAVTAVVGACSTGADEEPDDEPAAGPAEDTGCDPALDEALEAWEAAGFSGSVAVSAGGEFDCLAGYGLADRATDRPNTADTVFAIGSVSKSFMAAAVLDLVDAGRLSVTSRAGDLVPGLVGPAADLTVEQLLLHTSGLTGAHGRDHQPLGRDAAVAAIGRLELAFPPGTGFQYSNAGYTLLALIVEEASGVPYRDHVVDRALALPGGGVAGGYWDGDPAAPGPRAIGYTDDGPSEETGEFDGPHWALAGNGDLAMTMGDLASWTHALFTGGVGGPGVVDLLDSPRYDNGDGTVETPGWVAVDAAAYGVAFRTASGGGGDVGHDTAVLWAPEGEWAIAVASNTPDVRAGELLQAVGPALVTGDPLPAPGEPVGDVGPDEAAAVEGAYELTTGGTFEVTAGDDRLAVAARGADAVAALFPPPPGVAPEDVAAHERDVRALVDGATQEGRDERAALEADVGPIERIDLAGTVVQDGELRTWVTVASATESLTLWYALDDGGAVAAVEGPADPPTVLLGASGDGGYRPDDPTGAGPDVTVAFDDAGMVVRGPGGETRAPLSS
jgi:CubicO group peptidase (beta-lactamase class C family)